MSDSIENKLERIKELALEYLDSDNIANVMVGLELEVYNKEWFAMLLFETRESLVGNTDTSISGDIAYVENVIKDGKHSLENKRFVFGLQPTIEDALDELEEHLNVLMEGRSTCQ